VSLVFFFLFAGMCRFPPSDAAVRWRPSLAAAAVHMQPHKDGEYQIELQVACEGEERFETCRKSCLTNVGLPPAVHVSRCRPKEILSRACASLGQTYISTTYLHASGPATQRGVYRMRSGLSLSLSLSPSLPDSPSLPPSLTLSLPPCLSLPPSLSLSFLFPPTTEQRDRMGWIVDESCNSAAELAFGRTNGGAGW